MIGYVGFEFLGRVTLKREKKSEVLTVKKGRGSFFLTL